MLSVGHFLTAAAAAVLAVVLDPSVSLVSLSVPVFFVDADSNDDYSATVSRHLPESLASAVSAVSAAASALAASHALHTALRWFYNALVFLTLTHLFEAFRRTGVKGFAGACVRGIRVLPGVNELILLVLQGEIANSLDELTSDKAANGSSASNESTEQPFLPIPEKGLGRERTLEIMDREQKGDGNHCHEGRAFAFSYFNDTDRFKGHTDFCAQVYSKFAERVDVALSSSKSDSLSSQQKDSLRAAAKNPETLDALAQHVFKRYAHGNALNPLMFPTLRKYETEVISMTAAMLNGDRGVVGALTSGGTESILMAVKTYRQRARKLYPHITAPEIICPITIHPAFEKAGHYFDVKIVHAPVNEVTRQVDVAAMEKLINRNTIALCVSAPQYCHCVVDPVQEVGEVATRHNLPLHVDACFGGFILPWVEKLGYEVPTFDFRVKAVTSMTADCHKYGYVPKGASCVLYRTESLRRHMYYAYADWPGGLYVSPSMAGTRPGANIAMAWATLMSFGQDGYLAITKTMMDTANIMKAGVESIPGIRLVAKSNMTGFAMTSDHPSVNILAVADAMETKGWKMERQANPHCLHCSIMPAHANKQRANQFVDDLRASVATVRENKKLAAEGSAAMYGMIATIPDNAIINDFLIGMFNELYKTKPVSYDDE